MIPQADAENNLQPRPTATRLANVRKKIDAFKASNLHAPPRAQRSQRQPQPTQAVVLLAGQRPNNRGPQVPRQARKSSVRSREAFRKGAGVWNWRKPSPARDNLAYARDGEPRVAWPFRAGVGSHAERLRYPLRAAERTRNCSTGSRSSLSKTAGA